MSDHNHTSTCGYLPLSMAAKLLILETWNHPCEKKCHESALVFLRCFWFNTLQHMKQPFKQLLLQPSNAIPSNMLNTSRGGGSVSNAPTLRNDSTFAMDLLPSHLFQFLPPAIVMTTWIPVMRALPPRPKGHPILFARHAHLFKNNSVCLENLWVSLCIGERSGILLLILKLTLLKTSSSTVTASLFPRSTNLKTWNSACSSGTFTRARQSKNHSSGRWHRKNKIESEVLAFKDSQLDDSRCCLHKYVWTGESV